ncbi:MAG: cysteine--tRNA ligase [Solirubrobacterales bacterium]
MREIRINDTLSGQVRALEPRDAPAVGIYACGPTVYSRIHIGNARPYVIFSLLRRFLEREGYRPTLVVNVTDVNDKIYDAARELGVGSAEHAAEMTRLYREDTGRLGLGRPDAEPLATETMPEIIELIESLIERDHAYESGGDVYFRVRSQPGYGKLSNREPGEMDQGEEAGTASLKEDALDFALWKATKEGEDTSWPSPWGAGRPGWHIECSAMAEKLLGTDFEIHGGGRDLAFPHHENEIAQTEAGRGKPLARLWMHNGMVQLAEEKMSKSEGNIFGLAEALDAHGAPAVVAFLASGHYRQPLEFSDRALTEAAARTERIRNFVRADDEREGTDAGDDAAHPFVAERREALLEALADDFNTPRAFAALFELVAEANRRTLPGARTAVAELLPLLGLEALLEAGAGSDAAAEELLAQRDRARGAGDYELADRLRDELAAKGYEVRDGPGGGRLVPRA